MDAERWNRVKELYLAALSVDFEERAAFLEKACGGDDALREEVDKLIDAVDSAAHSYPWKTTYKAFPGPNSNTFTAWVIKQVPALDVVLPFSAIGSGYVE